MIPADTGLTKGWIVAAICVASCSTACSSGDGFGVVADDEEEQHLWFSTFWSWGPGEGSWRVEGDLPSGIDMDRPAVLQAHGEYVYAVVSMFDDAGAPALLRWRLPGG